MLSSSVKIQIIYHRRPGHMNEDFQRIFNQTSQFISLLSVDGTLLRINQTALRFADLKEETVVGHPFWDTPWWAHSPEMQRRLRSAIEEASAGRPIGFEAVHPSQDGQLRYFDFTISPVADDEGRVFELIAEGRDITERKQMEEELGAREREFRTILDNIPINIARWDKTGRYLYVNSTHERTLGRSLNELLGTSIPDNHANVRASIERAAAGEVTLFTPQQVPDKNGGMTIHEVSVFPEMDRDGHIVSVLGIGREITDFYRAQEALAAREREFRSLAENSPDCIVRHDAEGRFSYANPAWLRTTGLRAEEVIGKATDPVKEPQYWGLIKQVLDTGSSAEGRLSIRSPGGEMRILDIRAVAELDAAGKVTGVLAIGRDISESERAEAALRNSERRLADLVDFMPNAVLAIDREGKIIIWNRAAEELTGFKAADMLGKGNHEHAIPFYGVRRPILVDIALMPSEEAVSLYPGLSVKDGSVSAESHALSVNGSVFLWGIASPLYDSSGNITGAIECVADVTERKRAEMGLARQSELIQALLGLHEVANTSVSTQEFLDFSLEAILRLTKSPIALFGLIDEASTHMNVLAWSKEVMKGCKVADCALTFPLKGAGLWAECIRQGKPFISNSYEDTTPGRHGTPDGHLPLTRLLGVPVFSGDRIAAMAMVGNKELPYEESDASILQVLLNKVWEILERKQSSDRLQRLGAAVDQTPLDILITDADGKILFANPSVLATFGYTPSELLGQTPRIFKSGKHGVDFYRDLWGTLKAGKAWSGRLQNRAKDGHPVIQNTTISPLRNNRGDITGFVATRLDVTREVEMESRLIQAQKMEAIGTLAGGGRPRLQQHPVGDPGLFGARDRHVFG